MAAFTGIGFDSTKFTSISGRYWRCNCARAGEIVRESSCADEAGHLRRNLVRDHRDDAAAAERDQRDGDRVVAARARRSRGGT